MNMEKRKYVYNDLEVAMDANYTPEQVRDSWATIYPELKHANIVEKPDGSVEFTERAGTKGA
jgi:PRTRC genetic system protein C